MNELTAFPSESELDWLDDFLLNRVEEDDYDDSKDEGIIDLSSLDGFMTAIVSAPEVVLPSQWLPSIWGDFEPEFENEKAFEHIFSLLVRYMNGVNLMLSHDSENFEPIFLESRHAGKVFNIVDEWCEGYMRGVALQQASWQLQSEPMHSLIEPIKLFAMESEPEEFDDFNDSKIKTLQQSITPNAIEIFRYWYEKRQQEPEPVNTFRHSEPRPGRNDPCPCGSGKKYKKCCLH
jgi:uncharacterized protein